MFLPGVLCMVATGLMWVVIGAVSSFAARRQVQQCVIQAGAALMVVAVGLIYCRGMPLAHKELIGILALGGALNYLCFIALTKAMEHVHNAVAWAIMQSAMIFPFLMGILCFGVEATAVRLFGMGAILLALALMTWDTLKAQPKQDGEKTVSSVGLCWVVVSLLCAGSCQMLCNLPSYLTRLGTMSEAEKATWLSVGTLIVFALADSRKLRQPGFCKGALKPALMLGVVMLLAQYLFFFKGLDMLAQAGAGSIGYPIAIGVCVGGFSLYSGLVLKEPFKALTILALAVNVIGIVLLSL